jgi:ABC-2 type transport system ATP-binding protein
MVDSELIKFNGVSKKFKKNLILDSLNFNIPEGEITGLIGSSGSGKTTILKLLVGAYKPSKGEVIYLKKNILKDVKDVEKYFGFATEQGSFYGKLTVLENIFYFGKLQKMKKKKIKKEANRLLSLVGLDKAKNTLAEDLSMGMKKRLDITCALIHSPEVLVMDEPTSDLDPVLRKEIIKLIKQIKKKGTTIILTTQILEETEELLDNILILHNKKIVEDGDPKKIMEKYGKTTMDDVFKEVFIKKENSENQDKDKKNNDTEEDSKEIERNSDEKSQEKPKKNSKKKWLFKINLKKFFKK